MDRDEKRQKGAYATVGEVGQRHEPLFQTPSGRERVNQGPAYDDEVHGRDVGALPRSAVRHSTIRAPVRLRTRTG